MYVIFTMKLGLIGGGYWGKNLIREFNNCDILDIICDTNTDALDFYNKEYPHIHTTNNWNAILNNTEIDSVCISLPAEMHYKFAKDALECNKHVYVEKPIALCVEEAEELVNIAKERDLILMVGHLLHYHPAIIKIKEMIKEGKIGKILNIVSNRLSHGIFRTCENVLWSFAPHDISVILSLIGTMPHTIQCTGKDHITKGVHDITNSVLQFDDSYVNINVNWLNPYKEQKMSIIGENGMIVFDDTSSDEKLKYFSKYLEYCPQNPHNPIPVKDSYKIIDVDMSNSPLYNECLHFKECVETKKTPLTDGEEGVSVLYILNKLQESLDTNSKIYMDNLSLNYFKHQTAIIDDGAIIGDDTKIWHYSHICKGAIIGKNCNIGQNVFIAGGAIIGDNCKVQNNVSIYAGVKAGNYVFFGPSCVLTNDINPRGMYSKNGEYIETILEDGVTLGANSTIVCGNNIGKHSLIGAGAVITKNVDDYSIMVGNPAKKIGTIDEKGNRIIN